MVESRFPSELSKEGTVQGVTMGWCYSPVFLFVSFPVLAFISPVSTCSTITHY